MSFALQEQTTTTDAGLTTPKALNGGKLFINWGPIV